MSDVLAFADRAPAAAVRGRFDYVLDRIAQAEFSTEPYRHIYIDSLFSREDFAAITAMPEIDLGPTRNDEELFDSLFDAGYKVIAFPGCITDRAEYLEWHRDRSGARNLHSACEGFGMTLRLMKPHSVVIAELMAFLNGEAFQSALAAKFGLGDAELVYDAGIQKYLDGYEISPHPDIRKKALTYMVNINSAPDSEARRHHTHYLRFRPDHRYVQTYWSHNLEKDRCWVPWDWCETVTEQPANNSMVIFSPANDTLHAVKAQYDHLEHQRTQLYGNFWYPQSLTTSCPAWEDFVITEAAAEKVSARSLLASVLPQPIRTALRNAVSGKDDNTEKRFYQK